MHGPSKVARLQPRRRRTRYTPMLGDDGSVLVSAERFRQMDVEDLVERLDPAFIRRLRGATDDELAVLETFAEGLHHMRILNHEFNLNGRVLREGGGFDRVAAAVPIVFARPKGGA